jgi:hypothetical protein
VNKLKIVAEGKSIVSPVFTQGEYHAAMIVVHEPQNISQGTRPFNSRNAVTEQNQL